MSASITLVGRLGADPELRFTPSGAAVCSLRVVTDARYKDDAGQWQSKDTTWWAVNCWRQLAEHVGDSLAKGDMVIVVGKVKSREYETNQGEKRTVWEVEAAAIGPDLSRATAKPVKVERASLSPSAGLDDPWATPAPQSSEAPF